MVTDADAELIDLVYAATTGEGTLNAAVRKYLHLQGDPGGAMFYYDSIMEAAGDLEIVTVDDDLTQVVRGLFDDYTNARGALENPLLIKGHDELMAGKILVSDDVIPYSEFSKTEYYKAIFYPLGLRWSMGWVAAGRGQKWMTFTTARNGVSGKYLRRHLERGKLFQRHIARAIHIMELLKEAEEAKTVFEKIIEKLPQGILLVDDKRTITYCNSVASRLISKSNSLSDVRGTFSVGSTTHHRTRFDQWWRLLVKSHSSDGACFADIPMGSVWEIDVSRIAAGKGKIWSSRRWMLTLKQSPDDGEISPQYLIKRFGLTNAEAAVCVSLCRNGDAVSTSRALGLSPNTVRAHLKSIFKKTNSRNQVQLAIKLVSKIDRFINPIG